MTVRRTKANLLDVRAWLVRQNNQDLGQVMGVDFVGAGGSPTVRKDGFVEMTIPTGGITGIHVEEEGVDLGEFQTVNFVGAGVTATDAGGGVADVTIPGVASSGAQGVLQASDGAGGFQQSSLSEGALGLVNAYPLTEEYNDSNVRTWNPAPGQVLLSAAGASQVNLVDAEDGFVYTIDARVAINDGVTFASWRVMGIVFGAGGVGVLKSSTASADGPDAASYTDPAVVVSGATIQIQVTNPDATSRRWGVEASIQRLAAP